MLRLFQVSTQCRLAASDKKREVVLKRKTSTSSRIRKVPDFKRLHRQWAAKVETVSGIWWLNDIAYLKLIMVDNRWQFENCGNSI